MLRKLCLWLVLSIAGTAMAADQNFPLGLAYSEQIGTGDLTDITSLSVATDSQGAAYILANCYITAQQSILTKLTPAGELAYKTTVPYTASGMAVDPAGNAYVAGSNFVEKFGTDGKTVLYQTVFGGSFVTPYGIAVDATGRAYVTGTVQSGQLKATPGAFQQNPPSPDNALAGFVVRLTPSGAIDYGTYLGNSQPAGIAVDSAGSAFVVGTNSANLPITRGAYLTSGYAFLVRLSPDGSALTYSTYTEGGAACCVAVDSADYAVVALQNAGGSGTAVMRFNPQGTGIAFSKVLPTALPAGLAVDAAGNTYVASWWVSNNYSPKNSLSPCAAGGSSALTVLDGHGDVLQSTYIAGILNYAPTFPAIALGVDSAVYLVGARADEPYLSSAHVFQA
jgi:sugar lactone lactonase YvrE